MFQGTDSETAMNVYWGGNIAFMTGASDFALKNDVRKLHVEGLVERWVGWAAPKAVFQKQILRLRG